MVGSFWLTPGQRSVRDYIQARAPQPDSRWNEGDTERVAGTEGRILRYWDGAKWIYTCNFGASSVYKESIVLFCQEYTVAKATGLFVPPTAPTNQAKVDVMQDNFYKNMAMVQSMDTLTTRVVAAGHNPDNLTAADLVKEKVCAPWDDIFG